MAVWQRVALALWLGLAACAGGEGQTALEAGGGEAAVAEAAAEAGTETAAEPATEAEVGDPADGAPETGAEAAAETLDEVGGEVLAPACPAPGWEDRAFEPLPEQPDLQIHAAAAFDGQGIWLVYNLPDPTNGFDVWALRLGCDGTRLLEPFRVQVGDTGNDVDPDVVAADGRVAIAWQADTGGDPNMFIRYRVFQSDGAPVRAEDRALELVHEGASVAASAWSPRLAALPGGGFALVGAWAAPGATGFQVFVEHLGADGAQATLAGTGQPRGLWEPFPEPTASQTSPAIAALPDGTLHLAWERSTLDDENYHAFHTALAPAAAQVAPLPPAALLPAEPSGGVTLALVEAVGGTPRAALAFAGGWDSEVHLLDAADFSQAPAWASFGKQWKNDYSPALAPGPAGGGALAWYRVRAGSRFDVMVQRFSLSGEAFSAQGQERLLNPADAQADHGALLYPPTLAHLGQGVYFAAWTEGSMPALRLQARFVTP